MSIIEDNAQGDKVVRMAFLGVIAAHTVNGVAALHSAIIKDTVFRDFYEGARPSSALCCCSIRLSVRAPLRANEAKEGARCEGATDATRAQCGLRSSSTSPTA